jgi:ribonucleoside-diphosphate reductase alpha chain
MKYGDRMFEELDVNRKILSDIVVYSKYARYLPEHKRRETFDEIVTRTKELHQKKFPDLFGEIEDAFKFVYSKQLLPSMRFMQFAGKSIEVNPTRGYNCSFLHIDDYRAFSEVMFLLLGGTGVGYSVQRHHVAKLPPIRKPIKSRRFVVGDSIEGWADAIKTLMKAYMGNGAKPKFDFSDIRHKGAKLITSGGKAPGPDPLKKCLFNIELILDSKKDGEQMTSLECHDLLCYIADAVLAGGIRRAAMIALFSIDDDQMLSCKSGNWFEANPQRGRANNSAVVMRSLITKERFFDLWEKIKLSGCGEPGISFTNDPELGFNPCHEASLRAGSFCNLAEIDFSKIQTQDEFNTVCRAASFIGTLQAAYTDFHYLRDFWKKTTEKDSLLGVSMTGMASSNLYNIDLSAGAEIVKKENERMAKVLGINKAARTCLNKPSGTSSIVLGSASGIHAWHAPYYIRRMRIGKNEAIYSYLKEKLPGLVEDEFFKPDLEAVISIPIKAPDDAILRNESSEDLLERVKHTYKSWIKPGHRSGTNTHNISCTVSVKPNEWDSVGDWMWENREYYSGLSILPFDGGTYVQAPFEECSKETYEKLSSLIKEIDLSEIIEFDDETNLAGEIACGGGGSCEVK